jgi:lipoprotein-releasing system permease protein
MIPPEINSVSTINNYMIEGAVAELISNPDGIIVGAELARRLSLSLGDNITVASAIGQIRTFKILGIFRTGRADFDERQTFVTLKRVQAVYNRPNRVNNIIVKLPDSSVARQLASEIEASIGYKSISWQEASEDLMSTLMTRNIIMYTVVSAVLLVAAFGIFNVISTIVMEKQRDIAILKSMGFTHPRSRKYSCFKDRSWEFWEI